MPAFELGNPRAELAEGVDQPGYAVLWGIIQRPASSARIWANCTCCKGPMEVRTKVAFADADKRRDLITLWLVSSGWSAGPRGIRLGRSNELDQNSAAAPVGGRSPNHQRFLLEVSCHRLAEYGDAIEIAFYRDVLLDNRHPGIRADSRSRLKFPSCGGSPRPDSLSTGTRGFRPYQIDHGLGTEARSRYSSHCALSFAPGSISSFVRSCLGSPATSQAARGWAGQAWPWSVGR
ncbi:hypothetical protein FQR65_LT20922 [Abscondita terminalis]|nr:hypothetical protein FQR65_LT20922 [Abscondita terminalis]